MKKILTIAFSVILACALLAGCGGSASGAKTTEEETTAARTVPEDYLLYKEDAAVPAYTTEATEKIDKNTQARVIITTDMECDDTNGMLLALLFSNEYDLDGLIITGGMCHWQGDGEHTLAEITPNNRNTQVCKDELMEYRSVPSDAINKLITEQYAVDYPNLVQNDPNYPSPEELLAITVPGNVEFEGDVREDTEGSNLIKSCILDDDMRPLFIYHWGGANTTIRALLSIYEEYYGTDEWDAIQDKVEQKVYFIGEGEDNCYEDQGIAEKFPGIHFFGTSGTCYLGDYNMASKADESVIDYYQSEWLYPNFETGHGALLNRFLLMNDGSTIYGNEPEAFQFGLTNVIDFGWVMDENQEWYKANATELVEYDDYDWCCCQFGLWSLMAFGLRGLEVPNYGTLGGRVMVNGEALNRSGEYDDEDINYTELAFNEIANRGTWCVSGYADCNHAPQVSAEELDIYAKAGETVKLVGTVTDPDGDTCTEKWWVWKNACEYDGDTSALAVSSETTLETEFTIPEDAQSGDYFNIVMTVSDDNEQPMTRFAQVIVHVE